MSIGKPGLVRDCNGSTIVEMAALLPVLCLVLILSVEVIFYYYDKNILLGAAYETVQVMGGKQKFEEVSPKMVQEAFRERIDQKLVYFRSAKATVRIEKEELEIQITARRKGRNIRIEKRYPFTEPEKKIRQKEAIIDQVTGSWNKDGRGDAGED